MAVALGVQWLWQIKPDAFPTSLSEKHHLIKSDEGEHSLGKISHYMCKTKSNLAPNILSPQTSAPGCLIASMYGSARTASLLASHSFLPTHSTYWYGCFNSTDYIHCVSTPHILRLHNWDGDSCWVTTERGRQLDRMRPRACTRHTDFCSSATRPMAQWNSISLAD